MLLIKIFINKLGSFLDASTFRFISCSTFALILFIFYFYFHSHFYKSDFYPMHGDDFKAKEYFNPIDEKNV